MPVKVAMEAEQRLKCQMLISYGGSEFGSLSSVPLDSPPEMRHATVGKPLTGVDVKLLDDEGKEVPAGEAGNVTVRTPYAQDSYYEDPDATWQVWDKEGWVKTGDVGILDEQGFLRVVGRGKDLIIRGGQNIFPTEIENLLLLHPKVTDVAVVAMPDPKMGEKACAFVVTSPGQQFAFDEMTSFLKEKRIAAYKLPERLEIVDQIPLVAGSKVDKKLLRAQIAEKLKAEGQI